MCKITETQCFIHCTCNSYWSTLKDEPTSHEDYMQKTNLHLGYLGQGMFIRFELHTANTQFKIFGMDTPVEVNAVDTKPVVVGLLTFNEEETLNKLMDQGLVNAPASMTTGSQNRQASTSFSSQSEMDRADIKQEQQEGKQPL